MRLQFFLVALVLLAACASQPEQPVAQQVAKDTPLAYERGFKMDGEDYRIILASEPKVPKAGEGFNLSVSVLDKSNRHPPHLTYTLTIFDATGKKVFIDSFHDMDGDPYKKRVTLGSEGGYTLRLQVAFGMGSMQSEPFKGEFGFWVGG